MLRMSVAAEEYLMSGENIKLVFLGGTGKHMRIMIDAPKEVSIVRSRVIEKAITDPEKKGGTAKIPQGAGTSGKILEETRCHHHKGQCGRNPKTVIGRSSPEALKTGFSF